LVRQILTHLLIIFESGSRRRVAAYRTFPNLSGSGKSRRCLLIPGAPEESSRAPKQTCGSLWLCALSFVAVSRPEAVFPDSYSSLSGPKGPACCTFSELSLQPQFTGPGVRLAGAEAGNAVRRPKIYLSRVSSVRWAEKIVEHPREFFLYD
jgi:hypothetical protein